MKKRNLIIGIMIAILAIIAIIVIKMDIDITNYNYRMIGENKDFRIVVESSGQDIYYVWNGKLYYEETGSTSIEIRYIGERTFTNRDRVYYKYVLGSSGGEGQISQLSDWDKLISRSSTNYVIKNLDLDYEFIIGINDEKEMIDLKFISGGQY